MATLCISACASATEVRAWLDRSAMQIGETVTLNVEVSGDAGAAQPDFSVLAKDFVQQGTQSSTSVSIVNGQATSKILWAVALEPKHAGAITVPPLSVAGQQTQPITLSVQAATASTLGKAGDDLYVEVAVDPHAPYVQQQVSVIVKLYYAVNLVDGNLDEPQAEGFVVRKLGQDSTFNAEVGGRRYRVLERRYVLLPEKSGNLVLPAIAFRGHALDPGDVGSFFSRGRNVGARAQPVEIEVRARPASSGTDAWLPARELTLRPEGVDAATTARVGEPMTLTLRMQAQGLGFEQLPELKLPKIDGADVYPDKSSTQNRDDGEWMYGLRERKFAIVPNRPGALTIPEIGVEWWDTAHDRAETATIPALTLDVHPAAASTPAPSVQSIGAIPATSGAATPVAIGPASSSTPFAGDDNAIWRTIAILGVALWLVTMVGWIITLKKQRRRDDTTQAQARRESLEDSSARSVFRDAVKREDWAAASRSLLRWAQRSQPQLRNLGDLARTVVDSAQSAAVDDLQRARYGASPVEGLRDRLNAAFRDGLHFAANAKSGAVPMLPPLYPFRT